MSVFLIAGGKCVNEDRSKMDMPPFVHLPHLPCAASMSITPGGWGSAIVAHVTQ